MNREQRRQAKAARKRAARKSYEAKRNIRNNQAKPSAPRPRGRDARRKIANAPVSSRSPSPSNPGKPRRRSRP